VLALLSSSRFPASGAAPAKKPRVPKSLRVIVKGKDAAGRSFKQSRSVDLSQDGARLDGVGLLTSTGQTLEIRRLWRKASFRVVWVGQMGTAESNQVGLFALNQAKNIWNVKLPDTLDPQPARPTRKKRNRFASTDAARRVSRFTSSDGKTPSLVRQLNVQFTFSPVHFDPRGRSHFFKAAGRFERCTLVRSRRLRLAHFVPGGERIASFLVGRKLLHLRAFQRCWQAGDCNPYLLRRLSGVLFSIIPDHHSHVALAACRQSVHTFNFRFAGCRTVSRGAAASLVSFTRSPCNIPNMRNASVRACRFRSSQVRDSFK